MPPRCNFGTNSTPEYQAFKMGTTDGNKIT